MAAPSDKFIVPKTDRTLVRGVPVLRRSDEDFVGREINFIVHLENPVLTHRKKRVRADHFTRMNHA